jgi:hypothetical protein
MPKNVGGRFQKQFGTTFKDMFGMSKEEAGQGATDTLFDFMKNNPDSVQNGVLEQAITYLMSKENYSPKVCVAAIPYLKKKRPQKDLKGRGLQKT